MQRLLSGLPFMSLFSLGITAGEPSVVPKSYFNPVLPGFHPDPSCIRVEEWDNTFFCATSSFNAVPGVPIFASKDLQNFRQIGNVITRASQLPGLAHTNGSTSGIWAPTIRFHNGIFWVVTTLVYDHLPQNDSSRWDNIIFRSANPFDSSSWSDPVHFTFEGYDTSPFWADDDKTYIVGSHAWEVEKMIMGFELDFNTGEINGDIHNLWAGMGGIAPEAPHLFLREDGFYYLMIAEGGTGLGHEVNIARSQNMWGPYEPDPSNPVLTNANTSQYFQTVGHADIFIDTNGNWYVPAAECPNYALNDWVAYVPLKDYTYYPMGRETTLTSAQWRENQFPTFQPVRLEERGLLPPVNKDISGAGYWVGTPNERIEFELGSSLPVHFVFNRFPDSSAYAISPKGRPNTLRLMPSILNLTGTDRRTAATPQTFVARRQEHIEFTFVITLEFKSEVDGAEAGVSVFLNQGQHFDLGIVTLSSESATQAGYGGKPFRGTAQFVRLRTITTGSSHEGAVDPFSKPGIVPLGASRREMTELVKLQIAAVNRTTYAFMFSAGKDNIWTTVGWGNSSEVSGGFVGTLVGVFATGNGRNVSDFAYVSDWTYTGNSRVL